MVCHFVGNGAASKNFVDVSRLRLVLYINTMLSKLYLSNNFVSECCSGVDFALICRNYYTISSKQSKNRILQSPTYQSWTCGSGSWEWRRFGGDFGVATLWECLKNTALKSQVLVLLMCLTLSRHFHPFQWAQKRKKSRR